MLRLKWGVAAAVLLVACGQSVSNSGSDAGPPCVDLDHDGFGINCSLGRDCDDHNDKSTNECRVCAHPETGCACAADQPPIPCFLSDEPLPDGNIMCREGTRS